MEYRPLGSTDISTSVFALGTSAIGGLNWIRGVSHGWAPVEDEEVLHGVKAALDAGVNHFDTADLYGNGTSERRLAEAFHRLGVDHHKLIIASKVGFLQGSAEHPYHPYHIRRQCEQSLLNLRRDYLDLYYLHNADFGPDDRWLQPAADTVQALRQEGKIRLIGQSAYSHESFVKSIPVLRPDVVQTGYNALSPGMLARDGALLRLLAQYGITATLFGPLAQGRLLGLFRPDQSPRFESGDVRGGSDGFSRENLEALWQQLGPVVDRFGDDPVILAGLFFQEILDHPRVSAFLSGFQSAQQVRDNLRALDAVQPDPEKIAFVRRKFGMA